MYKVASDSRQSALHRGRLADWLEPEKPTTNPAERWADLRRVCEGIDRQLAEGGLAPGVRKVLGQRKAQAQTEINALRPLLNREKLKNRDISHWIVDVAREVLIPADFKRIFAEAERRARAAEGVDV